MSELEAETTSRVTTVHDVMTPEVATVEPEMSFRDALEVLRAEGVFGAPVVQNGRVVGVISVTDILEFEATHPGVPAERSWELEGTDFEMPELWMDDADSPASYFIHMWADVGAEVTERFETNDAPEWDLLGEHEVGEVMTRKLVAMPPEADLRDAARLMLEADVHRILVLEGEELLGIVTTTDVVRAVANGWGAVGASQR